MTPLSSLASLSSPSQWPNKSCTLRVLPLTLALKSCASWYCFPICSITLKCLLMHFLVHSRCDKSRNQRRNGKRKMSVSKPKKRQNRKKSRSKDFFFFSHLGSLERVALKIIHASIKTPGGQVVEEHDKIFHLFLLQQRQEFLYKYGRTIKSKSRRVSVRQSNVWAWVAGTPHDIG